MVISIESFIVSSIVSEVILLNILLKYLSIWRERELSGVIDRNRQRN